MNRNKNVPQRQATDRIDGYSSENEDLASMTNDELWQELVSAHKKLATIEHVEQLVIGMKMAEVARSKHYTKELATIEHIERLVAEFKAIVAARSGRLVEEGNRRD